MEKSLSLSGNMLGAGKRKKSSKRAAAGAKGGKRSRRRSKKMQYGAGSYSVIEDGTCGALKGGNPRAKRASRK